MCERAVKRLSYASFQYAPDQYKTQQMCESVSLKDQEKGSVMNFGMSLISIRPNRCMKVSI